MKYRICQDIEAAIDQKIETASEFEMLSRIVLESTKVYLSPTTLKRLWGYLKEDVNPRKTTLNTLARYLGYKSYDAYEKKRDDEQSGIVATAHVATHTLTPGNMLRVAWAPNRQCLISYEGNCRFRVVESVNSKLAPGDTFTCPMIVEHEPMYLSNLCTAERQNVGYVAGRRDGVTFTIIDPCPQDDRPTE